MQTRYLWVQQRVQERDLRLQKEPGDTNVSDALNQPLDEKRMMNLLTKMGYASRGGRTARIGLVADREGANWDQSFRHRD